MLRLFIFSMLLVNCNVDTTAKMGAIIGDSSYHDDPLKHYIVLGVQKTDRLFLAIGSEISVGANTLNKTINISDINNQPICECENAKVTLSCSYGRYRTEFKCNCASFWAEWYEAN